MPEHGGRPLGTGASPSGRDETLQSYRCGRAGLYSLGLTGGLCHCSQLLATGQSLITRGLDALIAELDHIKPDLLIIDPLINVMGGVSVNDNAAAAVLMSKLVGLATSWRMGVALTHHASKGRDITSAESAMGAASFINLARVALAIEPLEEKNAGAIGLPPWDAKSYFRVIGTKQNFAPPNTKTGGFAPPRHHAQCPATDLS